MSVEYTIYELCNKLFEIQISEDKQLNYYNRINGAMNKSSISSRDKYYKRIVKEGIKYKLKDNQITVYNNNKYLRLYIFTYILLNINNNILIKILNVLTNDNNQKYKKIKILQEYLIYTLIDLLNYHFTTEYKNDILIPCIDTIKINNIDELLSNNEINKSYFNKYNDNEQKFEFNIIFDNIIVCLNYANDHELVDYTINNIDNSDMYDENKIKELYNDINDIKIEITNEYVNEMNKRRDIYINKQAKLEEKHNLEYEKFKQLMEKKKQEEEERKVMMKQEEERKKRELDESKADNLR